MMGASTYCHISNGTIVETKSETSLYVGIRIKSNA